MGKTERGNGREGGREVLNGDREVRRLTGRREKKEEGNQGVEMGLRRGDRHNGGKEGQTTEGIEVRVAGRSEKVDRAVCKFTG